jgi:tetrapyrrole methylase family protein/MazG family protein
VLDALIAEARLRWGLDASLGLQVVAPDRLAGFPIEPSQPLMIVPASVLRALPSGEATAPVPGRHAPADQAAPAVLARLYPPDHPVGRLGQPEATTVGDLSATSFAGALYLGPVSPELATASPWSLPWIADRLRRPDGCPWDREQTHVTLKKHLLEEAYEAYDALGEQATPELAGELGDLLLQIVLHAQLAAEAGVFDMTDVQAEIGRKIVRRHPHVFGDARVRTASDVNRQWEQIKKAEREAAADKARSTRKASPGEGAAGAASAVEAAPEAAEAPEVRSALDGIARSMPALAAAQEMQERAAHLGYDWPDIVGIVDKIHEELAEVEAAASAEERREEIGDLLLVVTNLARRHGVDAEDALRAAAEKFRARFRRVERMARERNLSLREMGLAELDTLWDAAKEEERAAGSSEAGGASTARGKEAGR